MCPRRGHLGVVAALEKLLAAEDIDVVGRAHTGAHALQLLELAPTVLVTDLGLPDMSGMDVAREVIRADPSLGVVLYTGELSRLGAEAAVELGVRGIVLKEAPAVDLPAAIRIVAAGGTYVDSRLSR